MRKKHKKKYKYLLFAIAVVLLVIPIGISRMNAAVLDSAEAMGQESLSLTTEVMDLGEVETYASLDGKIYGATYWEGDDIYNPLDKEWYLNALEHEGETVYTDAYIDVRTNEKVVTLSRQIQGTQDVVVIDFYPDYQLENDREQKFRKVHTIFCPTKKGYC